MPCKRLPFLGSVCCNWKLNWTCWRCWVPSVRASFVLTELHPLDPPPQTPALRGSFSLTHAHPHTLSRSCSQAWPGFTHPAAGFKVMLRPRGDIKGCFSVHGHASFVYSWCWRSVLGYCCDVAHEAMNGFLGTGWALLTFANRIMEGILRGRPVTKCLQGWGVKWKPQMCFKNTVTFWTQCCKWFK